MHITDPGNPVAVSLPQPEKTLATNFFLATWAISLIRGENILGLQLRANTINLYLKAAATLITARGNPNPLDTDANKWTKFVIDKLTRYESVKNRREAFTDDMISEFHRRATTAMTDDISECLYDWIALGRYTGFRRSEWAQSRKHSYENVNADIHEARALIYNDLLFFDHNGHIVDKASGEPSRLFRVDIKWRWQKNGDNGQVISFWRDDTNPTWCPVRATWRICRRAQRFGLPAHEPIGKYRDYRTNTVVFLNTQEIETYFRKVAAATTGIKDVNLLRRMFGLHSLRVTACNELDRLGVNDTFIQRRLRWKSMTFAMYLRNTIYAARRHNLSNIHMSPHDGVLTAARLTHPTSHEDLPPQPPFL
jgi:hypothetical protein